MPQGEIIKFVVIEDPPASRNSRKSLIGLSNLFHLKMSITQEIDSFAVAVQKLPKTMRMFSLCLTSLYATNAVGSSAYNATGINKIRDQIRQDAVVYMKGLIPLSTQVARYTQELFEYYEALELDELKAYHPEILEAVTGYQQCCNEVVRMHAEMVVALYKRQDEAKLLISGLHAINKELKQKRALLTKEAASSKAWALGLTFVPVVGLFATPRLYKSATEDRAQAVAEGMQVDINEAAIVVVSNVLAPALSSFIDGLHNVAGLFNVMKEELTFLRGSRANQREPVRLHLMIMKKNAGKLNAICRDFHAMIPGVQTDLQCIPEKPGDQECFALWQIKHQEVFDRMYNLMLTAQLQTLLGKCKSIDEFQKLDINN